MRDIIESVRTLDWRGCDHGVCFSPDGRRYLLILAKGDIARDGIVIEFLSGETSSLALARPRAVARLFTRALGRTPLTVWNSVSWSSDNKAIAFLWEDDQGRKQAMLLDLQSGLLRQLTNHPTDVVQFTLSPDTSKIAYTAFKPRDRSVPEAMMRSGFAVVDTDAFAFLRGDVDGWDQWLNIELFVRDRAGDTIRQIAVPSQNGARWPHIFEFAPNGNDVVIVLPTDHVPTEWDKYTERFFRDLALPRATRDPKRSDISQIHVIDASRATLRPLWNAPTTYEQSLAWAPSGDSFVLGPTFLPSESANEAGLEGRAVAEVNIASGKFSPIPISSKTVGAAQRFRPTRWHGDTVELSSIREPRANIWFLKTDAGWRQLAERPASLEVQEGRRVRVELREDLNTAPALYAVDITSERHLVLDPNPQLRGQHALGHVESVRWKGLGRDGRDWKGLLYFPVQYSTTQRFPLVIQTHGDTGSAFSLIGDNHYPSVFAAQALANRNIAVLQMGDPEPNGEPSVAASPREAPLYAAGAEGAIKQLVERGLVDPQKVGVTGFSRTGWHVEYMLTHSDFRYAAAIVADNIDSNYLQSALSAWPLERELNNGGEPFGEGLRHWLERAPAFNLDRIRTPLRLQTNHNSLGRVLSQWELFGRLKHRGLPVELYVIPNMEQGTHNLQNPAQVLASAGGAVDWYDFWLNEREDPDSSKAGQYMRWRKLREQQQEALKRPRPPLLEWTAAPREAAPVAR